MVIEMDVVNPPFILDFGKAYIDIRPDFPEELLREHEITQRDLWGDQWQQVQSIVWQLERVGI